MNLEKRKQEIKVRLNEIKGLTGVEATLSIRGLRKEVDELKEEEETMIESLPSKKLSSIQFKLKELSKLIKRNLKNVVKL